MSLPEIKSNIECTCSGKYTRKNKMQHFNSLLHLNYLLGKSNTEEKTDLEAKIESIKNNNKENNVRITCDCKGYYTARHKSQHLKSKKHQKYLENN